MKFINKTENSKSSFILILALILLCGIIVGAIASAHISSDTANALTDAVSKDISQVYAALNNKQNFFISLWSVFKYPIFIFLLSFSVLGVAIIPVTIFVRGFSVSFSIGSIIKIFGTRGILMSLASFGINLFLSIPCLIIASSISLSVASSQIGFFSKVRRVMNGSVLPKGFFVTYGILFVVLILAFVLDFFVTPVILNKLI